MPGDPAKSTQKGTHGATAEESWAQLLKSVVERISGAEEALRTVRFAGTEFRALMNKFAMDYWLFVNSPQRFSSSGGHSYHVRAEQSRAERAAKTRRELIHACEIQTEAAFKFAEAAKEAAASCKKLLAHPDAEESQAADDLVALAEDLASLNYVGKVAARITLQIFPIHNVRCIGRGKVKLHCPPLNWQVAGAMSAAEPLDFGPWKFWEPSSPQHLVS